MITSKVQTRHQTRATIPSDRISILTGISMDLYSAPTCESVPIVSVVVAEQTDPVVVPAVMVPAGSSYVPVSVVVAGQIGPQAVPAVVVLR